MIKNLFLNSICHLWCLEVNRKGNSNPALIFHLPVKYNVSFNDNSPPPLNLLYQYASKTMFFPPFRFVT